MTTDAENNFISRAKKEVKDKIKTEGKDIEKIQKENSELKRANEGYDGFMDDLNKFIINCMQDFKVTEEDLPGYLKSNLNEFYQNYIQIRSDANSEIDSLKRYIEHCKKQINNNKRSLKFYNSQYSDSDFFDECLPLIDLYKEKIDLYEENIELTEKIIKQLEDIANRLIKW